ncbi:Lipid droplet-associated hydrolase [Pleurostoma richardsiae]|uniref:Lipid droplet-associated hydrolase n=1 Tax=Pleurostoma richardsiae TaxID=41990 RepID=A0AA38RB70_9PEZI|nr:Lipid droplet-associated hydrolase [Pleurostoma richardsiae]
MPRSLSYPPKPVGEEGRNVRGRQCLVYLITGNPGLVDYYEPFLSTLRRLLDETEERSPVSFHLFGRNLAGFEDDDHEPFTDNCPPHDLEFQVQHVFSHLMAMKIENGPRKGAYFDEVILIGHSVGSYISLEIFHRHFQKPDLAPHLNLRAGILLFATIAHLAKSPRGIYLERMRLSPFFDRYMHRFARAFLWLWPGWAMRWYLASVMGMPPHAVATTARFLTSRDAVWQALHLGKDEMRVIADDRWAEELWEVTDEAVAHRHEVPKFFILFGKEDYWVSNSHRDEFIKQREEHRRREGPAHKKDRTRIVVDEGNLPHDFCINYSEVVAEKVKVFIDEIAKNP